MVGKVTPNDMLSASRLPAVCGMSVYRSPNDELLASIAAINGEVHRAQLLGDGSVCGEDEG